ncbi:MAG: HAD-IA family hydrolase [Clostridia bacterium]|nr:HAD-IA family hydrolase [Clostridia bacterium]
MTFRTKLYNLLVNRVPGIRYRYLNFREKNQGAGRVHAASYLFGLNFKYYILRASGLKTDPEIDPDINRTVSYETQASKIEDPRELCEKLKSYDVISFDVFDTLILRKAGKPTDLFYSLQGVLNYPNFKRLRTEAEQAARARRYEKYGDYEVNLEEIWQKLYQISGIDVNRGIAAEWETELEFCYANPYFTELVRELKAQGKKLIICSDMYLGEQRIKQLLDNCGYAEFDRYYISCESRKSKHKGDLYTLIKNELGDEKSYIHIGDNSFSDFKQAKNNKFDAYLYPNINTAGDQWIAKDISPAVLSVYSSVINGYLHCGVNHPDKNFELGFIYGGLFVTGYCQYIHRFVENNSIDKILFLARDGEILKKAYEHLYPTQKGKCEYAYWSRLSSTKLSASVLKAHFVERMVIHKTDQNYKLRSIFATMEIEDMLDEFIKLYADKKYTPESMFDRECAGRLLEFIDNNWERICSHFNDEIEEGKSYYSKLLQDAKTACAVDVGWVGSGALILKKMFDEVWHFDCKLYGLMAGTCSANGADRDYTVYETSNGTLNSYLFSCAHNKDVWKYHDAQKGHNMLVELLLSSNSPSFRGFKKDENGNYDFNSEKERIDAVQIQAGIMKFVELYSEHPWRDLEISGRDAAAPIMLLYNSPRYVEKLLSESEIKANVE